MSVTYKKVETIAEFIEAIRIRVDVFIIEQKCPPGWEPDELDKDAQQYIALINSKIVATARLRVDPIKVAKIERMVIKKEFRKKGIYEKAGFKVVSSKPYDLWSLGIDHVDMEYNLE